ncbi:hypothetical protein GGS20DRAFT_549750 [Poronia punctata]|nr:hypothetical protein GGS20DRAFT_549750 [Poronia punctata]
MTCFDDIHDTNDYGRFRIRNYIPEDFGPLPHLYMRFDMYDTEPGTASDRPGDHMGHHLYLSLVVLMTRAIGTLSKWCYCEKPFLYNTTGEGKRKGKLAAGVLLMIFHGGFSVMVGVQRGRKRCFPDFFTCAQIQKAFRNEGSHVIVRGGRTMLGMS